MPTSGVLRTLGAIGSSLCKWSNEMILGCVLDDNTVEQHTANDVNVPVPFYEPFLASVASFFVDGRTTEEDSAQTIVSFTQKQLRRVRCPIWTVSAYEPPLVPIAEASEWEERGEWDFWSEELPSERQSLSVQDKSTHQGSGPSEGKGTVFPAVSATNIIEDDDWSEASMERQARRRGRRRTMGPEVGRPSSRC